MLRFWWCVTSTPRLTPMEPMGMTGVVLPCDSALSRWFTNAVVLPRPCCPGTGGQYCWWACAVCGDQPARPDVGLPLLLWWK